MTASATISPVNPNRTSPRGAKDSPGRVTYMRRQRIDPLVVTDLADLAMVELRRQNGVEFKQYSMKRFERWIDEVVIQQSEYNLGRARSIAAHCVVKRLTKGRVSEANVLVVKTKYRGMKVRLTEAGKRRLLDRAKDAHPASGAIKVVKKGAVK